MKKTSADVRIENLEARVSFLTAKLDALEKIIDPEEDCGFLDEGEFFKDWSIRDPFAEFLKGSVARAKGKKATFR